MDEKQIERFKTWLRNQRQENREDNHDDFMLGKWAAFDETLDMLWMMVGDDDE